MRVCDECYRELTGLEPECEDGCNLRLDHDGLCHGQVNAEERDEGQWFAYLGNEMQGPYESRDEARERHTFDVCEHCGVTGRLHTVHRFLSCELRPAPGDVPGPDGAAKVIRSLDPWLQSQGIVTLPSGEAPRCRGHLEFRSDCERCVSERASR